MSWFEDPTDAAVAVDQVPNEPPAPDDGPPPIEPPDEPPAATNGHARRNGHRRAATPPEQPNPYDAQAELALLGAAMLGAGDVLASVPTSAFYVPAHQHIAAAIVALFEQDTRPDAVLVNDWLTRHGHEGNAALLADAMATSLGPTIAPQYRTIVLDHYRARRLIEAAEHARTTARDLGADAAAIRLTTELDLIAKLNVTRGTDPDLDAFLAEVDDAYDWIVPGLLEHRDRVILTAIEGGGKSTLLRQLAVQLASGIHPFTHTPTNPHRVLYVDCENSPRQARRALTRLRNAAGDHYQPGHLRLRILGEAMALADPAVEADIAARILDHQADIVILGPLYKLITDDPIKEQPAKAVADAIDRLRNLRGSAFLIEAHSPYAEGSSAKNRPIRPYGASLWSRWPEFGLHLDDEGRVKHWRGQREQRDWPAKLQHDDPWPWAPAPEQPANTWDGPTECADAIVAFLEESGAASFSVRQLETHLRERGKGFRAKTIADAARLAHDQDRIDRRNGPRGSLLYSARTLGDQPFEEF